MGVPISLVKVEPIRINGTRSLAGDAAPGHPAAVAGPGLWCPESMSKRVFSGYGVLYLLWLDICKKEIKDPLLPHRQTPVGLRTCSTFGGAARGQPRVGSPPASRNSTETGWGAALIQRGHVLGGTTCLALLV